MARELVNMTSQNDELNARVEELGDLRTRYTDLDNRYNALLMMYGEKVEEAEELRLDLQDVKDMYKAQVRCCSCCKVWSMRSKHLFSHHQGQEVKEILCCQHKL